MNISLRLQEIIRQPQATAGYLLEARWMPSPTASTSLPTPLTVPQLAPKIAQRVDATSTMMICLYDFLILLFGLFPDGPP